MQELRLVLIIVGGLAVAGLLVHGIWTSKKDGKGRFADKPLNKMEPELNPLMDESEETVSTPKVIKTERKEPGFSIDDPEEDNDPLFGSSDIPFSNKNKFSAAVDPLEDASFNTESVKEDAQTSSSIESDFSRASETAQDSMPEPQPMSIQKTAPAQHFTSEFDSTDPEPIETDTVLEQKTEPKSEGSDDLSVIVFHVHAAGNSEFMGTQLFHSMQQNGLVYGAMDIFHRHTDISGTGKVLFSVANMMNPGTLAHDDPETFSTKGISFFMTLPCFGEPDQNFKLMLRTAQQIADDLGANVLDDKRNLMTPNRLSAYRQQIRDFVAREAVEE
ncbi:cell division protein ZipA [Vibrio rumoiensis]|uniref:Cell division protein ZipA n=1 Tax=Vibrio rumoiensis 1S-45 TaxID=1188252 RepID=A0A1E5E0H0_9VIBR|nr:cell division protein ZipA [Vibrio rumoiensis]OEF23996.1 cell division protein ZipA [Vibrio rumoiensis 1S-45]